MNNHFELLVITSSENFPGEEKHISFFLDNGASAVYLRKDNCSKDYFTQMLKKINSEHHQKLMLPFSAIDPEILQYIRPIVHLKEPERFSANIDTLPPDILLSTSIHDMNEWEKSVPGFHYVFFSPVFESISKPGYQSDKTLIEMSDQIKFFRNKEKEFPKLIALGGINENNIHLIKEAGFDGAALLGSIWKDKDPQERFLKIREKV